MFVPNNLLGKRVGNNRIRLINLLGEGSYGAVYHGTVTRSCRKPKHYAVKVQRISNDKHQNICLQRELRLHARVSAGDGIVTLIETFEEGGCIFIVMDYCPDGDLWSYINQGRFIGNDALIKKIFIQVLDATEYCHSRSVYHRDIKPENILLRNGGKKVLLADFGLATDEKVSKENRSGSPWYMSPECWGEFPNLSQKPYLTAPNDVWSLGVLLINLACARRAPWTYAHQMDRFFKDFTRQPNLLRLFVPLSPQVHDVLCRIFVPTSAARISIKDLKLAIQDVKSFAVPTSQRSGYQKYLHAVWKETIRPSPSRPVSSEDVAAIHPSIAVVNGNVTTDASRQTTLVPPSYKSSTPLFVRNTIAEHSGLVSREDSRSLPPLPQYFSSTSSSSTSSVDSDGPTTPDMPAIVPDIEMSDITGLSLGEGYDSQKATAIAMKPLPPLPLLPCIKSRLAASSTSWQGLLDAIQAM